MVAISGGLAELEANGKKGSKRDRHTMVSRHTRTIEHTTQVESLSHVMLGVSSLDQLPKDRGVCTAPESRMCANPSLSTLLCSFSLYRMKRFASMRNCEVALFSALTGHCLVFLSHPKS